MALAVCPQSPILSDYDTLPDSTSCLHGLIIRLPAKDCAAPANSERMREPCLSACVEIYS